MLAGYEFFLQCLLALSPYENTKESTLVFHQIFFQQCECIAVFAITN
jgi:hypothetical protein